MRKILIVLGSLLALAAVLGLLWLRLPFEDDRFMVEAARKAADTHFQDEQARAAAPQSNGVLEPTFNEFWQASKTPPVDPTTLTVEAWNKSYPRASKGKAVDHGPLLVNPEYLARRRDMEALMPALRTALSRPVFCRPQERLTLEPHGGRPNLLHVRELCQALAGLAASYVAEGKPAQAIEPLAQSFALAQRISDRGGMLCGLFGVACQFIAVDAWTRLLPPSVGFSAQQWREAARQLKPSLPVSDPVRQMMETELLMALNTFDDLASGALESDAIDEPGFRNSSKWLMGRESRAFSNAYVKLMKGRKLDQPLAAIPRPNSVDYLLGRSGPLTAILLGENPHRASNHILLNQARARGIYTTLALMAWRSENGEFPSTLASLEEGEVTPPTGERWDKIGLIYTTSGQRATLKAPLEPSILVETSIIGNPMYKGQSWFEVEADGLVFRL